MFCYQCKDASGGRGCVVKGTCGKTAECALLQDLLIQMLYGICAYTTRANELRSFDRDIDDFVESGLVATMTSENHDPDALRGLIFQAAKVREWAKTLFEIACVEARVEPYRLSGPFFVDPADDPEAILEQAWQFSIPLRRIRSSAQIVDLQEMILYGLKGLAKRIRRMSQLGRRSFPFSAEIHSTMDFLSNSPEEMSQLQQAALHVGKLYLDEVERERAYHSEEPFSPRFESLLDRDCSGLSLRVDGECELDETIRFIQTFQNRKTKDCELKSVCEWSADRIEPTEIHVDFFWEGQEGICFYLALLYLGIYNIRMHPQPAFLPCRDSSCHRTLITVK